MIPRFPRLNARKYHPGFTIVELLIVIVVIGILSVIAVVAFNGVRQRAAESTLKADLNNASKLVESRNAIYGGYPLNLSDLEGNAVDPSGDNQLQFTSYGQSYSSNGTSYCITAVSNIPGVPAYRISSVTKVVEEGYCEGHSSVNVTSIAGSSGGYLDGTGTDAQLNLPMGMAMYNNELYVADYGNHRIRKVTASGVVTTIAGSGTAGGTNGNGTAAQFSGPSDIVVKSDGTIYVSELTGHRIRQITPSGDVTTLAGSTSGFLDATGTSARFSAPSDLALGSDGTIYVSDRNNNRIRKVTAAGVVTTLAGSSSGYVDATGTAARFSSPDGLAVDDTGAVYVSDDGNDRIRKVTAAGVVTTLSGTGVGGYANGAAGVAQFQGLGSMRIGPDGMLYVSDWDNYHTNIRKVNTTTGAVEAYATFKRGSGAVDGVGANATFNVIQGIVFAPDGTMYVVGMYNNRIARITAS